MAARSWSSAEVPGPDAEMEGQQHTKGPALEPEAQSPGCWTGVTALPFTERFVYTARSAHVLSLGPYHNPQCPQCPHREAKIRKTLSNLPVSFGW